MRMVQMVQDLKHIRLLGAILVRITSALDVQLGSFSETLPNPILRIKDFGFCY